MNDEKLKKDEMIGKNHAKAMFYQGLAELGNALTADSNITQRHLEHGIYGYGEPPPEEKEKNQAQPDPAAPPASPESVQPSSAPPSAIDGHVRDAQAQARATRERAARETPVQEQPGPTLERD